MRFPLRRLSKACSRDRRDLETIIEQGATKRFPGMGEPCLSYAVLLAGRRSKMPGWWNVGSNLQDPEIGDSAIGQDL